MEKKKLNSRLETKNLNWKKLLGFRNMQEKLENNVVSPEKYFFSKWCWHLAELEIDLPRQK